MGKKQKISKENQSNSSATQSPERIEGAEERSAGGPELWSKRKKIVLSIIAVFHLFAVFAAPWAIPQPSSQLARDVNESLSPWTHAFYMRHGYRFFAPDPGPSHLILYEVSTPEGDTFTGRFPDREKHRPRLMYHRFFMISEHFWGLGTSGPPSNEEQIEELRRAETMLRENGLNNQADWILDNLPRESSRPPTDEEINGLVQELKREGKHFAARTAERNLKEQQAGMALSERHRDAWLKGIANYLKRKHGGTAVRIWIQEHLIPNYSQILDGEKLTDANNYGPRQLVYAEEEVIE